MCVCYKTGMDNRSGTWQQNEATLKYQRNCGIGLKNCN